MPSREIERSGDKAQDSRENESRANGRSGGEANDQDERRYGEAAAADARQADRESDQDADEYLGQSARFDSV